MWIRVWLGVAALVLGGALAADAGLAKRVTQGTDGPDVIRGGGGSNDIAGRGGDDLILGFGGRDGLYGDSGADRLIGGGGDDWLHGGEDADQLVGGRGADRLDGSGDDVPDDLRGGPGAPDLCIADTSDAIGPGCEVAGIADGVGGLVCVRACGWLRRHQGAPVYERSLLGSDEPDLLDGSGFDDGIRGHAGDDQINGLEGDDTIRGDDGADLILGGPGADDLDGAEGSDRVFGGAGNDEIRDWVPGGVDLLSGGPGPKDVCVGVHQDSLAPSCEAAGIFQGHSRMVLGCVRGCELLRKHVPTFVEIEPLRAHRPG